MGRERGGSAVASILNLKRKRKGEWYGCEGPHLDFDLAQSDITSHNKTNLVYFVLTLNHRCLDTLNISEKQH